MRVFLKGLRQPRMACKITQTRVAELLAVSPRAYTRRENGDVVPQFATVVKIANILNVSCDDLAGQQESNVGDARSHNPELPRLCQKVDQLSDADQKALVIVRDSLVRRSNVSRAMAEL